MKRSLCFCLCCLLLIGSYALQAQNQIVYITPFGAGNLSGSSWDNAAPGSQLQNIINDAVSGTQLWVAKGTYQPAAVTSFSMVPNVKIYGGFAGGDTSLSQRNITANPAILKGNGNRVIFNNGLSASAVLDGFTITGGNAGDGGGMLNFNSSPIVTNCTFYANKAGSYGGGMYNILSSPTVTNCTFSDNTAITGGGIHTVNSSPTITSCTFTFNTAGSGGGGIHTVNSSSTITSCTFSDNTAIFGGGIYSIGSSLVITNCTFSNNKAEANGGAMFTTLSSSPRVTNCTFNANSANFGGAVYNVADSPPVFTNCIIWGNTATNSGPAIYNSSYSVAVVTYSIVQGGYNGGTNNLDTDPLFVSAASGDLRLQPCSPAINRGLTSANNQPTDIAGNNRVQSAGIDIGAYESPYNRIPAPAVSITPNLGSTICVGTTVTFTATAVNGGTAPVYQWKKNGTIVGTNSATYTTSTLSSRDTITLTLTYGSGCIYPLFATDTLVVTVNAPPAKPTITAIGSITLCSGSSVKLTSSPAFAYRWSTGSTSPSITVTQSGAYNVAVTNANGCTSPASDTTRVTASTLSAANISINPVYTVSPGGNANTIYLGYGPQSVILSSGTVSGGTAPYTYQWSPATGLNNPLTASSVTAHPLVTTTYTLTIKDQNGCSINKAFTVNVIDARCGNKNDKVVVCHAPPGNPSNAQENCISSNAVAAQLANGSTLGPCSSNAKAVMASSSINSNRISIEESTLTVAEANLRVAPNPSTGAFTVELHNYKVQKAEVSILNLNGSVVEKREVPLNGKVQTLSFNLQGSSAGMYLVKVVSAEGVQTARLLVQR